MNFCTLLERGLKVGKAGRALLVDDDHFAIEDRTFGGKLRGCAREFGHPMRPIEALACEKSYMFLARSIRWIDLNLDSVTVEFQFVDPIVTRRGAGGGFSQLRADETGEFFFRDGLEEHSERWFLWRCFLFGSRQRSCGWRLLLLSAVAVPYAVVVFGDLLDGACRNGAIGL